MKNNLWWIIPLLTFVIPIVYHIFREIQWKINFQKWRKQSSENATKNSEMMDVAAIYVIGWCIAGALLIGHFL